MTKEYEELIKLLEDERDTMKTLAEGAKVLFPQIAKALAIKRDKELVKLLTERE